MKLLRGFVIFLTAWCICAWGVPLCCHAADAEGMEALEAAAESIPYPDGMEALTDGNAVMDISPSSWVGMLWDTLCEELRAPLVLLSALLTLTLLSSVLGGMRDAAASDSMGKMLDLLCILVCVGAAAEPLGECLTRTAEALHDGSVFMASFVPVFSGFLAAGGAVAGGTSYQVLLLFLTESMQQLNDGILFPLLRAGAALGMADAVHPSLHLGGLVGGLRKGVTTILGTLMTAFAALLSVRSFVADAADGLAMKTAKLLTSTLIPIVGGAVSDACGTVQGSIRMLQSGTGVLGILAIAWLTVPPLCSAFCYRLAFGIAGMAAETAGAASMQRLCRDAESILAAAAAMLVIYALMLMFSTAIMLMLMTGAK